MSLKNCSECGKVFAGPLDLCPECKKKEEDDYELVYKFLRDNPRSTIDKVSDKTGVDRKRILKFVRKGEIASADLVVELKCVSCGATIEEGKVCAKCAEEMEKKIQGLKKQEVKEVEKKPKIEDVTKQKTKMHIIDHIKERRKG